MSPFEYAVIIIGVALIGSQWSLHRDMRGLSERIARLEGAFDGLRDAVNRLDTRMTNLERSE